MILSTLGRLILVPIAFVLAAVVSALVLLTLGLERITQSVYGAGPEADQIGAVFDLFGQGYLLLSGLTIIPALLVVLIGEVARIRSWLYYILGGGAALAAIPLIARFGQVETSFLPPPVVWQVFATAGFAGGFVYWLLAGRRA
jgi:hypothetical protein